MNEIQRILALDAALCACEGTANQEIREAISFIQDKLEKYLEPVNFDDIEQINAVRALADNPQCYC